MKASSFQGGERAGAGAAIGAEQGGEGVGMKSWGFGDLELYDRGQVEMRSIGPPYSLEPAEEPSEQKRGPRSTE